jgi:hypothetical protein
LKRISSRLAKALQCAQVARSWQRDGATTLGRFAGLIVERVEAAEIPAQSDEQKPGRAAGWLPDPAWAAAGKVDWRSV